MLSRRTYIKCIHLYQQCPALYSLTYTPGCCPVQTQSPQIPLRWVRGAALFNVLPWLEFNSNWDLINEDCVTNSVQLKLFVRIYWYLCGFRAGIRHTRIHVFIYFVTKSQIYWGWLLTPLMKQIIVLFFEFHLCSWISICFKSSMLSLGPLGTNQ